MAYTINGMNFDLAVPMLIDGTTFVPLGNITDALGGFVEWDNMAKIATVELGSQKVRVQADNDSVETSEGMKSLQAAPFIENATLWVPVRFFEQIFGCTISVSGDDVSVTKT